MVVEKDPESEQELPLEHVERVGEYFKSLFVRSLRLNLGDGSRERPWGELPAPPGNTAEGEAAPGKAPGEKGAAD
jgi:hypothetical protein